MEMETRTAKGGYTSKINARIYYSSDGKMTTYYDYPREYIIFNNAKGEIKVYNVKENTVIQEQNFLYSTETTQLYYFLQNSKSDLGLTDMGFVQQNIKFEDGLIVTDWLPPANLASELSKVEMVHEQNKPIYIAYYNQENTIGTKSYFYDYSALAPGVEFPASITQIQYLSPTDSTVTKTTYSNFSFDNQINDSFFEYKIPDNAKTIN